MGAAELAAQGRAGLHVARAGPHVALVEPRATRRSTRRRLPLVRPGRCGSLGCGGSKENGLGARMQIDIFLYFVSIRTLTETTIRTADGLPS